MLEIRQISPHISLALLDLSAFASQEQIVVKRDLERAGTLYVLKHLLKDSKFELDYSPERKPFLKNRAEHISISHSHDKLAIILNKNENTGIDIELMRDKVRNIQQKFLDDKELQFANNDVERLVTLWAAKETLYKIYGLKEIEFSKHLKIEPFNGDEIIGHITLDHLHKKFILKQETIDKYKLVYALYEL